MAPAGTEWLDEQPYPDSGVVYEVYVIPMPSESESVTKKGDIDIAWEPVLTTNLVRHLLSQRVYTFERKGILQEYADWKFYRYVGEKTYWKEPGKKRYTFSVVPMHYDDVLFNYKILKECR